MSVNFMEKRDQLVEDHIKENISFEINDKVKHLLTNLIKVDHSLSQLDELSEDFSQIEGIDVRINKDELLSMRDSFVTLKERLQNDIYTELCMSLSFQWGDYELV